MVLVTWVPQRLNGSIDCMNRVKVGGEIHEALDYGVVKMNMDTDMQYAFTRAIADHFFKNFDGALKADGEVGHKRAYDPRSYLTLAETAMAERVKQAVKEPRAIGTTIVQ
jgi:fructose-bisphosphate aldolase class II